MKEMLTAIQSYKQNIVLLLLCVGRTTCSSRQGWAHTAGKGREGGAGATDLASAGYHIGRSRLLRQQ